MYKSRGKCRYWKKKKYQIYNKEGMEKVNQDFEIMEVKGLEVLDSRGNPTVEVSVRLKNGIEEKAMVPSGASTGRHEAIELRDKEKRYGGKGVEKAIANVNIRIADRLIGQNALNQRGIDQMLMEADGTENKGKYGANAILGASVAVARAAAKGLQLPLYRYLGGVGAQKMPLPMMNILNGGCHAPGSTVDFQEFMILPTGGDSMKEKIRMGAEVYHALKYVLQERNLLVGVGDEGGFTPHLSHAKEAFSLITEAVERAGYRPGEDICYAMDVAASELYDETRDRYYFPGESKMSGKEIYRNAEEMVQYYEELIDEFPIISIEDGLNEDDMKGWKVLTYRLGGRIQLVGDDLFVTNQKRIQKGIEDGIANAVLIKMNQIGTLSETIQAVELAKSAGYKTIISHRSGDTEDTTIADLAVALNTGQIKTGAPCRSDRTAKYNRLLRIAENLEPFL